MLTKKKNKEQILHNKIYFFCTENVKKHVVEAQQRLLQCPSYLPFTAMLW